LLIFFFALLCLAGLFAPFMRSHDAQFYFDRGSETLSTADPDRKWTYRWELNSARADFSHAIRLNPNFTAAYTNRAVIEFTRGDADKALKDYTAAIRLNPQDPNNYVQRAGIEAAQRDLEQALGDYKKAIELQPDNRVAYRGRVRLKEMQNDFAGAMMERVRMIEEAVPAFTGPIPTNGDFFARNPGRGRGRLLEQLDRALAADTNFAWGYYYRGVVKSLTNDWGGALADFQRCQNFPDDRVKAYAAIHIWLVQTQIGERGKADQELLAYCQNRTNGTPADWQMQIAKFLLNQISETDFSKAIDPSDTGREQSEFWYYTGMKHLFADNKAGASDCFRKSLATKARPFAVFFSARAELSSLDTTTSAE
jgi:tetratricopeptide (TPR) repeat protein